LAPTKTPCFPSLRGPSDSVSINKALIDHFLSPKDHLPSRDLLTRHPSVYALTHEPIAHAWSKSSPSFAPSSDAIPYLGMKKINYLNTKILLELLSALVSFGYHHPTFTKANGGVFDKPGKASYDSSSFFNVLVLLKTVSKIVEQVMTVRLSVLAPTKSLFDPNQCGSLPGLDTFAPSLSLTHEVRTLQGLKLWGSTVLLGIEAGFDNVDARALRSSLLAKSFPSFIVDLVSSFLPEGTCTGSFQGSPNLPAPV